MNVKSLSEKFKKKKKKGSPKWWQNTIIIRSRAVSVHFYGTEKTLFTIARSQIVFFNGILKKKKMNIQFYKLLKTTYYIRIVVDARENRLCAKSDQNALSNVLFELYCCTEKMNKCCVMNILRDTEIHFWPRVSYYPFCHSAVSLCTISCLSLSLFVQ